MVEMKVYLSSWSGLVWFTLPLDPEEVKERLRLSSLNENYIVLDTENFPMVKEEVTIEELNRIYHKLEDLPDWLIEHIYRIVYEYGNVDRVLEAYEADRIHFYEGVAINESLAYYLIHEKGILGEVSTELRNYIDYYRFALDYAEKNYVFDCSDGVIVITV